MCAMPLEHEIAYPESDGQPMAETTLHREVMSDVIGGLERRYAEVPDVWVGGNLFFYYEEGRLRKKVAPDVLLALRVRKWKRRVYRLWEERTPALIFEITSLSTRDEDTGEKKDLYERLGVEELVFFDPYNEYLTPRLQGYRLEGGRFRSILPNRDGSLDLWTTGLTVRAEGERLRLVDTATGEKLLWNDELEAARRQAEERAAEEAAARRSEVAARRAAQERAVAEAAARQAAEERAAAAEDLARSLAEELARLRGGSKGTF